MEYQTSSIQVFRLSRKDGSYIELSNLGAGWLSWIVPNKNGLFSDILLGYPHAGDYLKDSSYLGSTVGRFANRIGNATFTLNNKRYILEKNDGRNSNHGGSFGLNHKLWQGRYENGGVVFRLHSPHMEGGYPGNIELKITYSFTENGGVSIRFQAISDRNTILNLTNHAYFNLSDDTHILNHYLQIPSDYILETNREFIPTGNFHAVQDTEFDFTFEKRIGADIHRLTEQLQWNKGYNHCYVLSNVDDITLKECAILSDYSSGRRLKVSTTYPGLILYSAGYLETEMEGKKGYPYRSDQGICLETQYFPDSPNHSNFLPCNVSPKKPYDHISVYDISIC